MPRFFIDKSAVSGDTAIITGDDARHIRKVLRMREGEPLTLCDGCGTVYEADIAALVESGDLDQGAEPLTTQRMSELYPLFATSLLSLVKNAESAVTGSIPGDR